VLLALDPGRPLRVKAAMVHQFHTRIISNFARPVASTSARQGAPGHSFSSGRSEALPQRHREHRGFTEIR
jgi:hypothetical protein